MKYLLHDIRISRAEAIVLLELSRRLRDEPALAAQLNPAELAMVTTLVDVLSEVALTSV